jgi:hypothetical protein
LSSRFIVYNTLWRAKNGDTQASKHLRNVTITTISAPARGTNSVDAAYGMLAFYVFELDLKAFVTLFRFSFRTVCNETPFLKYGSKPSPEFGMRVGAGSFTGSPGIAYYGNKISNCIVNGHIS